MATETATSGSVIESEREEKDYRKEEGGEGRESKGKEEGGERRESKGKEEGGEGRGVKGKKKEAREEE
uniref:Uncharacterized protein n=1 Tax=Globodera rostochiensis TaxID=31243 RepID=A0A914H3Z5_GLORO